MADPKFAVTVRKYAEYEVPVEAASEHEAKKLVQRLIDEGDTKFMVGTYVGPDWEVCVASVSRLTKEDMDGLMEDCEVVNPDGTHGWR